MSFIDDLLFGAAGVSGRTPSTSPLDRALAERRSAADTLRFLGDLEASFPDRPAGPVRPAADTAKFQFEQVFDPTTGGARMALVDRETGDILGKSLERAVRILDDAPQQEGTDWNDPLRLDRSLTAPAQRQELILDTLFAGNREPGPFELPTSADQVRRLPDYILERRAEPGGGLYWDRPDPSFQPYSPDHLRRALAREETQKETAARNARIDAFFARKEAERRAAAQKESEEFQKRSEHYRRGWRFVDKTVQKAVGDRVGIDDYWGFRSKVRDLVGPVTLAEPLITLGAETAAVLGDTAYGGVHGALATLSKVGADINYDTGINSGLNWLADTMGDYGGQVPEWLAGAIFSTEPDHYYNGLRAWLESTGPGGGGKIALPRPTGPLSGKIPGRNNRR